MATSGIGQLYANPILNAAFQAGTFTGAATQYWALFTVQPSDTALGTEVPVANNYVRLAQTMSVGQFPAASGGSIALVSPASFLTPSGSWGTVIDAGLMAASSGGTQPNYWYDVTTPQAIASGNPVTITGTFTFV